MLTSALGHLQKCLGELTFALCRYDSAFLFTSVKVHLVLAYLVPGIRLLGLPFSHFTQRYEKNNAIVSLRLYSMTVPRGMATLP